MESQAHILAMRTVGYFLLAGVVMLAVSTPAEAQTVEEVSRRFRNNIVRITTQFEKDFPPENGFGFVIRESNDTLFVVTASHVVINDDPSVPTESILIGFGNYVGTTRAILIQPEDRLNPEDRHLDLALLAVLMPRGYQWSYRRAKADAVRGDRVWIVGRDLTWKGTAEDFSGQVSEVRGGELKADFSGAKPGASGGPLLSRRGIVGLVVNDQGHEVTALTIERVRRVALTQWLGIEEIDLPEFPFFAITGSVDFSVAGSGFNSVESGQETLPPAGFALSAELAVSPLFGIGADIAFAKTRSASVRDRLLNQRLQFQNSYTRYRGRLHLYGNGASGSHLSGYLFAARLHMEPQLRADKGEWLPPDQLGVTFAFDETAWAFGVGVEAVAISYNNVVLSLDMSLGYTTTPTLSIDITDPFTVPTDNDLLFEFQIGVGYAFRSRKSNLRILR